VCAPHRSQRLRVGQNLKNDILFWPLIHHILAGKARILRMTFHGGADSARFVLKLRCHTSNVRNSEVHLGTQKNGGGGGRWQRRSLKRLVCICNDALELFVLQDKLLMQRRFETAELTQPRYYGIVCFAG
jgi:hypothetical protein